MTDQVSLQGYKALALRGDGMHIRVRPSKTETSLVEVISSQSNNSSIFILNVYNSPIDHRQRFKAIITRATKLAENSPLVVAGDFNAPFHAWNYPHDTVKSRSLRRGTSLTRDSVPDLAFVKNAGSAVWSYLLIDLAYKCSRKEGRPSRSLYWDKFREVRKAPAAPSSGVVQEANGGVEPSAAASETMPETTIDDAETKAANTSLSVAQDADQEVTDAEMLTTGSVAAKWPYEDSDNIGKASASGTGEPPTKASTGRQSSVQPKPKLPPDRRVNPTTPPH
ncbi:hypothetical protein HPB49_010823 [Dermacentor silvarum]|uniref:Uncharacterized protein n=1 Tax=Dermacentor silvarum TaxID=543639 RepID=A0ACB8CKR2_DERSI|nr:hypothetical protein HPB49_010823 [Dermacentor silvarum]